MQVKEIYKFQKLNEMDIKKHMDFIDLISKGSDKNAYEMLIKI